MKIRKQGAQTTGQPSAQSPSQPTTTQSYNSSQRNNQVSIQTTYTSQDNQIHTKAVATEVHKVMKRKVTLTEGAQTDTDKNMAQDQHMAGLDDKASQPQ